MTSLAVDPMPAVESPSSPISLTLLPEEYWWGGAVENGFEMPFRDRAYRCDLRDSLRGNQAAPLLLSNKGRYVWCPEAFAFAFDEDGRMTIAGNRSPIVCADGYGTLAGAYRAACVRHFSPSGRMPDPLHFSAPQYNSWIEMQYEPTQAKVLDYARQIGARGLPPGVLMIDDNWFEDHGDWRFHPGRFPDPVAMIGQLHEMGFRVMLWISPFISPDGAVYRDLAGRKLLVRDAQDVPVVRSWWNGQSALLDVTHPEAVSWLQDRLEGLMTKYAVDGFKFDAGDPEYFLPTDVTHAPTEPVGYCEAWARLGLRYPFNEYRACWKLAGQPLVQRLRDKYHDWGRGGLADIVPNGLAQGLMGYSFTCPDMIGGGDIHSFVRPGFELDQELFVRTVQCSALFPILQFSIAPWRVLDEEHWDCCRKAIRIRQDLVPYLLALARHAAETGEPIMRHMEYVFPGHGFERIDDQFLLGAGILVAPVTTKGAERRTVVFPPGSWAGSEGELIEGPCSREVEAPLSRLPWYRRISRYGADLRGAKHDCGGMNAALGEA